MKLSFFIISAASLLFAGCSLIEGHFVLTNPQSVIGTSTSKVSIDSFRVNGTDISSSMKTLTVRLKNPRQQLAGIGSIEISGTGAARGRGYEIVFSIGVPSHDAISQLHIWPFWIGIDDLSRGSLYPEESYRIDLWKACPVNSYEPYQDNGVTISVPLIARGAVILEQRTKHIKLKGTFDIPSTPIPRAPYMVCKGNTSTGKLIRNPALPAIIEAHGIHLDIDTDLIFQWCGEGANCYEK